MLDEAANLGGETLRRLQNCGVEDDAQHVVGNPVDAEMAARPAREGPGEHLGQDAQAITFVTPERKDRSGRRRIERLRVVSRPAV